MKDIVAARQCRQQALSAHGAATGRRSQDLRLFNGSFQGSQSRVIFRSRLLQSFELALLGSGKGVRKQT